MGSTTPEQSTASGAAVYSYWFLIFVYNVVVLHVYCPVAWGCSAAKLTQFYNRNVNQRTKRVLDIGVGTGYYLERTPLHAGAQISLVDLNRNCLDVASKRIKRVHAGATILKATGDFFDHELTTKADLGDSYDAISMMFLLHCLPGPPSRKASATVRSS